MDWTSTLAKHNSEHQFATKKLVNSLMFPLVGIHEFKLVALVITYKQNISDIIVALKCNLLTSYELNERDELRKVFQPLCIRKLNGRSGTKEVISLNNSDCYSFCDTDLIEFWLDSLNNTKIAQIELSVVHFMYRKKKSDL